MSQGILRPASGKESTVMATMRCSTARMHSHVCLRSVFIVSNIPYKIVGGVNFYARKEVKDLLAYLKTIDNARDDLAVRRIINVPKRGIGATTLNRVSDYAEAYDISFYESLKRAEEIPSLGKSAAKIKPFVYIYPDDAQQAALYRCGGSAQRGDRGDGLREGT